MKTNRVILTIGAALVLFALALTALAGGGGAAVAAPQAVPTPVSVTRPAGDGFQTFTPFAGTAITEDTTSTCIDVANRSVIDLLYVIDQGTTNTTTLTTKWSIDGATTVSGINVVASNAADASDMVQLQVFGRYFCLLADVANTNPITINAQAIAK